MRRFLRNNGLTLFLVACFALTFGFGQITAGWRAYNEEREENGKAALTLGAYLTSAHFVEATGENWESEFLQMFVYVVATSILFQKGSAESHDPDKPKPTHPLTEASPGPAKRGGWALRFYSHSLSLALAGFFVISFTIHAFGSLGMANEERAWHGEGPISLGKHLLSSTFWFESFQNWQSEFLSIAMMVVLSIFLRERGSPESKPVEAPHFDTGETD